MGIKNISALVLVFALVFALCACRKLDGSVDIGDGAYAVDENGVTRNVETTLNDKNEVEYFYTDGEGNSVTVESKEIHTTTAKAELSLTPEQESFVEIFNNPDEFEQYTEAAPEVTLEMSDDIIPVDDLEKAQVELDSNGEPVRPARNILSGEKFTLKMNVINTTADNGTQSIPVYLACDGDKIYIDTQAPVDEGSSMHLTLIKDDKKASFYLPGMKVYMEAPLESAEGVEDQFNINSVTEDNGEYVETVNYTDENGDVYEVDVYKDGTSETRIFYLGDEIRRAETTDSSTGDSTIWEFTECSADVDKSVFNPPTGYLNVTDIMTGDYISADLFPALN
ncbi:MAG: hypothetical protein K6F64_07825 [Clostridia bacterium]|nr:hypothetical protein [Clostridia bacterium]